MSSLSKLASLEIRREAAPNVDPLTNMALQGALQHHRTFSSQRMKSATSMNGWPHLLLSYSRTSSLMHCPDPFKMIYYLFRSSSAVYAHIKSGNILNSAYQLTSFPEFVCTSVALLHPASFSMRCPDPFKKWIYYLTRSSSTVSCRPAMASLLIGPMGLKKGPAFCQLTEHGCSGWLCSVLVSVLDFWLGGPGFESPSDF